MEKGWGFLGIGPLPTFWSSVVGLTVTHSTSGCVVQHVDILQGVYNEAQGLLEVKPFTILGLVDSNQFMLYPQ